MANSNTVIFLWALTWRLEFATVNSNTVIFGVRFPSNFVTIKYSRASLENAKKAVREIDRHNYLETWESRARPACELRGERTGYKE